MAATLAALMVTSLFVGAAAAVTSEPQELPEESEVGSDFEATFELTDLFDEFEEWTLAGETNLTNVTWTVWKYDAADSQIEQTSYDGQAFNESITIDEGVNRVEVRVTGTTPEVQQYQYDPAQQFRVAEFTLERGGGTQDTIASHETHHYTADSAEARQALDSASEAVDRSGDSEASDTFGSAVSAYEAGNFGNAIDLAERAEEEASSSERRQTFLLYGAAAAVLLVVLGAGYYLYQARQQEPDRLR